MGTGRDDGQATAGGQAGGWSASSRPLRGKDRAGAALCAIGGRASCGRPPSQALRAAHRCRAQPASSRPRPGRRCGVNWLRQFNIRACCPQSAAVARKARLVRHRFAITFVLALAPFGFAGNRPYVLRPFAPARTASLGVLWRLAARLNTMACAVTASPSPQSFWPARCARSPRVELTARRFAQGLGQARCAREAWGLAPARPSRVPLRAHRPRRHKARPPPEGAPSLAGASGHWRAWWWCWRRKQLPHGAARRVLVFFSAVARPAGEPRPRGSACGASRPCRLAPHSHSVLGWVRRQGQALRALRGLDVETLARDRRMPNPQAKNARSARPASASSYEIDSNWVPQPCGARRSHAWRAVTIAMPS